MAYSFAGRIGNAIEPIIRPMGFDWRIGTALIGAIAAKEVFVSQMGIVFSIGEANEESVALRDKLTTNYSMLTGFCIMLFMLIAAPCMPTFAVTKRESNSWRIALSQFWGLTMLGYIITVVVYQTSRFFTIKKHGQQVAHATLCNAFGKHYMLYLKVSNTEFHPK